MLLPILPGTDGMQKMSKSLGNTVGLLEAALDMYSKLEKLPDAVVDQYVTLLTDLDPAALPRDPRERQKAMALAVTAERHGEEWARLAQAEAVRRAGGAMTLGMQAEAGGFSLRSGEAVADTVPVASLSGVNFPAKAFYLLSAVGVCISSSEARRAIQGGGVRLDGEKLSDPNQVFSVAADLEGKVLQVGRKTFRRLVAG
jgi:tyrosyl-tRNA synthetase